MESKIINKKIKDLTIFECEKLQDIGITITPDGKGGYHFSDTNIGVDGEVDGNKSVSSILGVAEIITGGE